MQHETDRLDDGPLADLGTYPMHMVANAFAFDHYCHLRIDPAAQATVESSAHDFVRWGTERCDWRECCSVVGDEDYAAVLDTLDIV